MDLGLTGKRAVITGGSKGIGLGCAIGLAREGCHVQLAARNDETLLRARASVLEAATNVEVETHSVDLSVSEDQMALVDAVGDVDIWINNAGVSTSRNGLEHLNTDEILNAIDTNLTGSILCTKIVAKEMLKQGFGEIYMFEGFGSNGQLEKGLTV